MPDSNSPAPGIAVVIATVGRADALKVCLDSLAIQTVLPAEIVIVHSGSDAETRMVAEQDWAARGLMVEYLTYPQKSAALQRDFAVRRTSQPLIMFADDDMEFEPRWIETLLGELMRSSDVGAVMGRIVNQNIGVPTPLWQVYRRLVARPPRGFEPGAVVGALVQIGFPDDAAAPMPAEWLGGCITLLRKDAYISVNGFAPHFRGSSPGEDVDLGYRISRRWKVTYVPSARCLHHQSLLGREGIARHQYLSMRSRYAFCRASAAMSVFPSLWHISLWAAFQSASELSQARHGKLRRDFLAACWGRLHGLWSCLGWDPTTEQFPEWHEAPVAEPSPSGPWMRLRHAVNVLRRNPRPIRLATARLLEWTGLSPLFTIKLDGYRLRFYPTNVSSTLWINPESRFHSLDLFKDYGRPGDVSIDVGANVGEVSIILSQRARAEGHVYAFEPHPRTYRYLLGNLSLNRCSNVTAANLAIGATAGTTRLSDGRRDDMNRVLESGGIEVTRSTLDQQVPEVAIAFLKIDVEGSELRVLEGAGRTLQRTACVNCEMSDEHYRRYGYGSGDLIRFLQQAGFRPHVIAPQKTLRAVDERFSDPGFHELVAVRDPAEFVRRTGWRIR